MAQLHSSVLAKPALVQAGLRKCLTFSFALLIRLAGRTIRFQTRRDLLMRHEPAIHDNKRKLGGATRGLLRCGGRQYDREPQSSTDDRAQGRETADGQRGGWKLAPGSSMLIYSTRNLLRIIGAAFTTTAVVHLVGYVLQTGSGARTGLTLGNACSATPPSKA